VYHIAIPANEGKPLTTDAAAADFFHVEAWTRRGLTRFPVLFLINLSSRRVEIAVVMCP